VYTRPEAAEVAAWFLTQLDDDHVRMWVATAGGASVGYVSVLVKAREGHLFCHARAWWEVDQIGVHPAWRRRGVARALLRVVAADAEQAGWTACCSRHRASTPARKRHGVTSASSPSRPGSRSIPDVSGSESCRCPTSGWPTEENVHGALKRIGIALVVGAVLVGIAGFVALATGNDSRFFQDVC